MIVVALVALASTSAVATPMCDDSAVKLDLATATLARVRVATAHFYRNGGVADCPPGRDLCRAQARVVAGDELVVTATTLGLSCATFVDAKGRSSHGWLRDADLAPAVPAAPTLADWVGRWHFSGSTDDDEQIKIARHGEPGHLTVTGYESRLRMGGSWIDGDVVPLDDRAAFSEGKRGESGGVIIDDPELGPTTSFAYDDKPGEKRCRVALRRLGPYLLATDNDICGAYQTFRGVYARVDTRAP